MLSVADALAHVLGRFKSLDTETVTLQSSVGRVLAQPVHATLNLPPFPNSSMDGYAVRAEDIQSASETAPTRLTVIADIPAGIVPTVSLKPGTTARIMTGAHMPEGANAVVPVESTDMNRAAMDSPVPETVQIQRSVDVGAYVRHAGEDVRLGDEVIKPGHIIRAHNIGLLAAFGLSTVSVVRRPRVAVLATGDELVAIDQVPGPGQIRDSNSHNMASLVRRYGGEPIVLGVAGDQAQAVTDKLNAAVDDHADLIVSSAGVSVGAYDVVKTVIESNGALDFWKVKMRPGKPVAFGNYKGVPFFGLPGNPVSTVVSFEIFVRPVLLKLSGHSRLEKPTVSATLEHALTSDGRETYLRASVSRHNGQYVAKSAGGQGSNILSALVTANAFIIIPEGVTQIDVGETLQAWMLDWPEEVF
jgi:molybdopterin molybdotransferase